MAIVVETPRAANAPQCATGGLRSTGCVTHSVRCLVVSESLERRKTIAAATASQAWEALICCDAGEFLRAVRTQRAPLMIVDLPQCESDAYGKFIGATEEARRHTNALMAVCGYGRHPGEEIWARSLGAWTYMSGLDGRQGFETLLEEARLALVRSGAICPEQHPSRDEKLLKTGASGSNPQGASTKHCQ